MAMPATRPAPVAAWTRLPGWQPDRQRKGAVAGALVVTLAALWALWAPPPRHAITPLQTQAPTWLRLLPPPAMPAGPAVDPPALPRTDPPARRAPPKAPELPVPEVLSSQAATPQPITLTAPTPTPTPTTPPAPAASSPAPLRLGDEVLRRAARDSIAETRRLAAEAGLPAERGVSGGERLADGVEQAAKPDCLASNPGGSLLSIPIIALQALRQKCK